MQQQSTNALSCARLLLLILFFSSCTARETKTEEIPRPVAANIKKYTTVWDNVMNKDKLDMLNDSNFTKDVQMQASPAKAYYANFLTGFSNIQFNIKDVFGQGDKLVKHWNFKGTHTGLFFGIPATGNTVSLNGTTLVGMTDGKIAEERDFYDNLDFMTQPGLIPPPGK